jgi:hypothetical protein
MIEKSIIKPKHLQRSVLLKMLIKESPTESFVFLKDLPLCLTEQTAP